MSTIKSEPLKDGKPIERASLSADQIALALALLFLGGLAWVIGGKFTVEGWAGWLNTIGAWIGIDGELTAPRGWLLVASTVAVGLIYSFVELRIRSAAARRQPLFWLAWLPLILTDIGSTYAGIRATPDTAPLIIQQVAAAWPLAVFASIVLTFIPEYMVIGAIRLLRRLL